MAHIARHTADGSSMYRRQRSAILERDDRLLRFVLDRLAKGWTPEHIAGSLQARCGDWPGSDQL